MRVIRRPRALRHAAAGEPVADAVDQASPDRASLLPVRRAGPAAPGPPSRRRDAA